MAGHLRVARGALALAAIVLLTAQCTSALPLPTGRAAGTPSASRTATAPAGSSDGRSAPVASDGSSYPLPSTGDGEVGVLFRYRHGLLLSHCVATVVSSASADVVLTAAHCLGRRDTYRFAPDYTRSGAARGLWTVISVHTDAAWQARSDPLDDFAFLTVQPSDAPVQQPVQEVTGGLPLGRAPGPGESVRVIGYPSDRYGGRLGCTATVHTTGSFPTVDCPYFTGGTSGSPLISRAGLIVGIVGGWQSGGCTSDVSYTSPFTQAMESVLSAAVLDAPSSPWPRIGDPAHCQR